MTRLLVIFTASEVGGLLAIVHGHLWLGVVVVLLGSQAAVRYDDGYRKGRD